MKGLHRKYLWIAFCPYIVDGDPLESPFLPVAHQFAIVAVHEERALRATPRAFPGPEMLGHDIRIERGGIVADLDLEIAGGVARVERPDQRDQRIHDGLAAVL